MIDFSRIGRWIGSVATTTINATINIMGIMGFLFSAALVVIHHGSFPPLLLRTIKLISITISASVLFLISSWFFKLLGYYVKRKKEEKKKKRLMSKSYSENVALISWIIGGILMIILAFGVTNSMSVLSIGILCLFLSCISHISNQRKILKKRLRDRNN